MQLARDRDSGPAAPPIPRSDARCGRRRSVSRRPHCVEPVGGDQWKPVAEKAVSNRLSHMQCTGLRKFRNSAIESLRSISSQLPVPRILSFLPVRPDPPIPLNVPVYWLPRRRCSVEVVQTNHLSWRTIFAPADIDVTRGTCPASRPNRYPNLRMLPLCPVCCIPTNFA